MYPRLYKSLKNKSFFLFGPRGSGKTTWLKDQFPEALRIDLLDSENYRLLLGSPQRLEGMIPKKQSLIVIDEIQRVPDLLNEVHRLIEDKKLTFVLTGSSARKLKRHGANLLAGRAFQKFFHPLTCWELGKDFNLDRALKFGMLPEVWNAPSDEWRKQFLSTYIATYLKEEVQAEGLVRNLSAFSHFLEMASFSQAAQTTMTRIAADVGVDSKVIASYFEVCEDLLLSYRIPVFNKRAKRRISSHPKFMYFDVGVWRALRPKGPLDSIEEIDGPAIETLFFQHYRALGEFCSWNQKPFFWRTATKLEVDFVSYGEEGIFAFEFKRSSVTRDQDLDSLREFQKDYPMAKCYLLNFSSKSTVRDGIQIMNFEEALWSLPKIFGYSL